MVVGTIFRPQSLDWLPLPTHCMLVVKNLEGQDWLVDVGYGDCFVEPLLLTPGLEQDISNGTKYRIAELGEEEYCLQKWTGPTKNTWLTTVKWTKTDSHELLTDFEDGSQWVQNDKNSRHFLKSVVSVPTLDGYRKTLSGLKFIKTKLPYGEQTVKMLSGVEEFEHLLEEEFGIVLEEEADSNGNRLTLSVEKTGLELWAHL